jgi:hypothetical protein
MGTLEGRRRRGRITRRKAERRSTIGEKDREPVRRERWEEIRWRKDRRGWGDRRLPSCEKWGRSEREEGEQEEEENMQGRKEDKKEKGGRTGK